MLLCRIYTDSVSLFFHIKSLNVHLCFHDVSFFFFSDDEKKEDVSPFISKDAGKKIYCFAK